MSAEHYLFHSISHLSPLTKFAGSQVRRFALHARCEVRGRNAKFAQLSLSPSTQHTPATSMLLCAYVSLAVYIYYLLSTRIALHLLSTRIALLPSLNLLRACLQYWFLLSFVRYLLHVCFPSPIIAHIHSNSNSLTPSIHTRLVTCCHTVIKFFSCSLLGSYFVYMLGFAGLTELGPASRPIYLGNQNKCLCRN